MKRRRSRIVFLTCLFMSIALLVTGFLIPPMGVIDGSVLKGVAALFAFATLDEGAALAREHQVKVKHGDTVLQVGKEENSDSEDEPEKENTE